MIKNFAWRSGRRGEHSALATSAAWSLTVAVAVTACSTASSAAQHVSRAIGPAADWVMPLPDAHRTTLAGARGAVGFAIPMPDVTSPVSDKAVSSGQISLAVSQVWVNPARQVALVFDGGRVTMLIGRATHKNALAVFRADLAAIKIGRAAIGHVNGVPAFVAWPRTDYTKSNPTLIEFYLDGLDIHMISTRLKPSALLAIADTVRPAKS